MTRVNALLTPDRWLDFNTGTAPDRRRLADTDFASFAEWALRYRSALGKPDQQETLLKLGREIHDWLNGDKQVLDQLVESSVEPPLLVEFTVNREPDPQEQAFLDAPWELLADNHGHWALRDTILFCPVRRLGTAVQPPPPSPNRLTAVFMAASPEGLGEREQLNFEAEETAILQATAQTSVDLIVEESGTLPLLNACVAREKPELVHVSCHGEVKPAPGLLLEDDLGDPAFAKLDDIRKLAAHSPRLMFLSACKTAETDGVVESLARSLAHRGLSAVLGWSGSVYDHEAALYAASLYRLLAEGHDLCSAVANARLELANSDGVAPEGSRDWHLARLYLGPKGGGTLATVHGPRRHAAHGRAYKAFLDTKGNKVPVAGEFEFVGRRRQIQKILREFRAPANARHAGVFVHGLGRQGKSSLAARVAHRLQNSHELVVAFGRYDAPSLLEMFREFTGWPAVTELVEKHRAAVAGDSSKLFEALVEILEGPCRQEQKDAQGKFLSRPALLVIDDFEQALDEQHEGRHRIKSHCAEAIAAAIKAFNKADTESRLLFTSRYEFTLRDGAADLASRLLALDLVPMQTFESCKQADAKVRARTGALAPSQRQALRRHLPAIIENARGNPGLQDLLFSLCLQDAAACERCLAQMKEFLEKGTLPDEQKVREFLENLAIQSLIGLLSEGQRELLRASTLFGLPIPLPVMTRFASALGSSGGKKVQTSDAMEENLARLVALSLWEIYPDAMNRREVALAVNALVRPQAGQLNEKEQQALAALVVPDLFQHWGGTEGTKQRPYLLDHELARLAVIARDAQVLAATAADALRFLRDQFHYRQAATLAKDAVAILDAAGIQISVDLLRTMADRLQQVGDVTVASAIRKRALGELGQSAMIDVIDHAATLIDHARALAHQGQPDEALKVFEQARQLLPEGRERTIVLGDIARIRAAKGEVDEALQLHQEELSIYEALGDKRSRAVTLGDIARILADKGEVVQALQLHQEALAIYEVLGEKSLRAGTLVDIARIRAAKGDVDQALQLHQEALGIYEA